MVLKGKARGGHAQLVRYMMHRGENESVDLLHIGGTMDTENPYRAMEEFALSQELTGSKKAFYHGQISPAPQESLTITDEQYVDMAYRTAKHLGFEKPRIIITKHTKNGHVHIHYAIDRYDYGKGKLVSDSYNYYKHDDARAEIEKKYRLVKTPRRNMSRGLYKEDAKEAWESTKTGQELIDHLKDKGYTVAKTIKEPRPYRLIDAVGKNNDLVRQIEGVRTAEVRERLKDIELPLDSDVITQIRQQQAKELKVSEARTESKEVTESVKERQERQDREYIEEMMRVRERNRGRGYER